jgi:hypothetical protein
MVRVARRSEDGWRRLTACVLVFALILQGIAFTVMADAPGLDPSGINNLAGFELCSHNAATPPSTPTSPAADTHCTLCLAGASYVLDTATAALDFHTVEMTVVSWLPVAWRLPATTVDANSRPRGPPSAT